MPAHLIDRIRYAVRDIRANLNPVVKRKQSAGVWLVFNIRITRNTEISGGIGAECDTYYSALVRFDF